MSTAKRRMARTCRAEVVVDAPIESVWQVIARVIPRQIDRSAALTDDLRRIAAVAAADRPSRR